MKRKQSDVDNVRIQTDQNGHARLFICPHVRESKEHDGSLFDNDPLKQNRADVSIERVLARSSVAATSARTAVDAASERAQREKKKQTREMSPQTMSEPLLDENSERCVDDDEEARDARRGVDARAFEI